MSNWKRAALNSLGVLLYVAIVATVMNSGEKWFAKTDTVFTAIAVLMLFTLSAAVVGSLVIGKPIFLYIDGKKKEAISLLTLTVAFLAVITFAVLLYLGLK